MHKALVLHAHQVLVILGILTPTPMVAATLHHDLLGPRSHHKSVTMPMTIVALRTTSQHGATMSTKSLAIYRRVLSVTSTLVVAPSLPAVLSLRVRLSPPVVVHPARTTSSILARTVSTPVSSTTASITTAVSRTGSLDAMPRSLHSAVYSVRGCRMRTAGSRAFGQGSGSWRFVGEGAVVEGSVMETLGMEDAVVETLVVEGVNLAVLVRSGTLNAPRGEW